MESSKPDYGDKTIYHNSLWSLIFMIGGSAISFFTAPLLLFILGEEKYGVWVSLLSLISWIYYCDAGIGNSMRNKVASSIAEDDYVKAKKFAGISYVTVSIISLCVFLIVLIATRWFDICGFFNIRISGEDLNLCLLIAILYACINFVASLANNILYAVQRSASVGFFNSCAQILFLLTLSIFALTGIKAVFWVAIGEGTCQLLKNIIETVYVYTKYPELKFSLKDIEWSYSKGIMSLGIMMFIRQLAVLILNTTDNLVISKYLSAADVTPYDFCHKYFNVIDSVYAAMITPLLSAYTMAYTKKDVNWIKKAAKRNVMLYVFFLIGTIMAMLIFERFAALWLRKELTYAPGLIISTMIFILLLMFCQIVSTILTGFGKIREITLIIVAGSVMNIPISIYLATNCNLGTTGVIIGSVLSLLPSVILYPLIALKEIRKLG